MVADKAFSITASKAGDDWERFRSERSDSKVGHIGEPRAGPIDSGHHIALEGTGKAPDGEGAPKEHPRIHAVLFDLDGTLLDTKEAIIASLVYTVEKFTGRKPGVCEIQSLFGLTLSDQMKMLCPERAEEMVKAYVRHNLRQHRRTVKVFPGVSHTLQTLRDMGCRLAVVTSKRRRSAIFGLRLFSLDRYFDALVCAEDVENHKPHPEPVLKALTLLGVPPAESVTVGDSVYDIQAGRAAGTFTAACLYGMGRREELSASAPDVLLRNIFELVLVLRGVAAPGIAHAAGALQECSALAPGRPRI